MDDALVDESLENPYSVAVEAAAAVATYAVSDNMYLKDGSG